ncbi:hypothetical protein DCAR_0518566 [Daucus carota subsp. sativus]|uniref:Uncharacterized protein n=1 Tax=Daucus carota subsp. sativus TaxID=79200 RepID=A0A164XBY5_DAUCS|nr:hypothetical protein DCAR_0518566 [Daucus carota subsp. sativus]
MQQTMQLHLIAKQLAFYHPSGDSSNQLSSQKKQVFVLKELKFSELFCRTLQNAGYDEITGGRISSRICNCVLDRTGMFLRIMLGSIARFVAAFLQQPVGLVMTVINAVANFCSRTRAFEIVLWLDRLFFNQTTRGFIL